MRVHLVGLPVSPEGFWGFGGQFAAANSRGLAADCRLPGAKTHWFGPERLTLAAVLFGDIDPMTARVYQGFSPGARLWLAP